MTVIFSQKINNQNFNKTDSNQDELNAIISKWQTAYYLSQAILEDYAKHMSKIEGKTPEEIKKLITESAQENLNKSKIKK